MPLKRCVICPNEALNLHHKNQKQCYEPCEDETAWRYKQWMNSSLNYDLFTLPHVKPEVKSVLSSYSIRTVARPVFH
jgi:hypothetical protein